MESFTHGIPVRGFTHHIFVWPVGYRQQRLACRRLAGDFTSEVLTKQPGVQHPI